MDNNNSQNRLLKLSLFATLMSSTALAALSIYLITDKYFSNKRNNNNNTQNTQNTNDITDGNTTMNSTVDSSHMHAHDTFPTYTNPIHPRHIAFSLKNKQIVADLMQHIENRKTEKLTSLATEHNVRVIVVCVDPSHASHYALLWARDNVFRSNVTDIIVELCVWDANGLKSANNSQLEMNASGGNSGSNAEVINDSYERHKELVRNMYKDILAKYKYAAYTMLLEGPSSDISSIAEVITQAIEQIKPDIVVMGSRKDKDTANQSFRSNQSVQTNMMSETTLGSVSEYVLSHTHANIVVVASNRAEK